MTTKTKFLAAYRELLPQAYEWAKKQEKLDHYMQSVSDTIAGNNKRWNASGNTMQAAWRKIGMTGKATLKGLRELPYD